MGKPWSLTAKQALFLAYDGLEAMIGGAKGPGKSVALLVAALQYIHVPGYRAILFRRTYPELKRSGGLMDLAHQWLHQKARWNENEKTYHFPNGSRLEFGYMESEQDKLNYQGGQWDFIGFDELVQFSETQYLFMFGGLRKKKGATVPMRIRSGTNPGALWVKKRFVDYDGTDRIFFPALFTDNEYLDIEDYDRQLAQLPHLERKQYRHGDWNAVADSRFKGDWLRYFHVRDDGWWVFGDKAYSPLSLHYHFAVVDCAATVKTLAKPDPDYTAISTFCLTPCNKLVWKTCKLDRYEAPDIIPVLKRIYKAHRCEVVDIESGGMQKAITQLARREGDMNVYEFTSNNLDKVNNAVPAMHMMEAGRVWIPEEFEDAPEFDRAAIDQLLMFTGHPKSAAHDDAVDNLARAARRVNEHLGVETSMDQIILVRPGPFSQNAFDIQRKIARDMNRTISHKDAPRRFGIW